MHIPSLVQRLKSAFEGELPGIQAHEIMSPINRPIDISTIQNLHEYRSSAVALICYEQQNDVVFVLIQRPHYEGNHSGQISFPGGKVEESDLHLEHTARRETYEEIGVSLSENDLIGKLSNVFIPVSRFIIEPYVYYLDSEPTFIADEREVNAIFCPSLHDLQNDDNVRQKSVALPQGVYLKNVPYFHLHEKEVWGATALILSEFKELLKRIS